jgi:hypothetical protein
VIYFSVKLFPVCLDIFLKMQSHIQREEGLEQIDDRGTDAGQMDTGRGTERTERQTNEYRRKTQERDE